MSTPGNSGYGTNQYLDRKSIPLPEKFKCRVCKQIKALNLFSKKEHLSYQNRVYVGARADPIMFPTVRCRGCSGAPIEEMECHGPCNMFRALDEFSKSQREDSPNPWCSRCITWKMAQPAESGITTQVAQGQFSPEGASYTGQAPDDNAQPAKTPATSTTGPLVDVSTPGASGRANSSTNDGSQWAVRHDGRGTVRSAVSQNATAAAARPIAPRPAAPSPFVPGRRAWPKVPGPAPRQHYPELMPHTTQNGPEVDSDDEDEL